MTLPQPVQDFGNLFAENATTGASFPMEKYRAWMYGEPVLDSAALQAQSEAERKRLGPVASALADMAGYQFSLPAQLNRIPYAGGALAGATQEGVKSALEGDDWTTAGKNAGKGLLYGLGSTAASSLLNPTVLSKIAEIGGTGLATHLLHAAFGESELGTQVVGGQVANSMIKPAAKWLEEHAGRVTAPLQPAINRTLQGVGSAVQASPGNMWSQWGTGS